MIETLNIPLGNTQIVQGEVPDSTLVSFDSDGYVVQQLGSC
jgi:hypothetical protein